MMPCSNNNMQGFGFGPSLSDNFTGLILYGVGSL
jgi:hypothetical protein